MDSNDLDESEVAYLEEDLQALVKESNKKILEDKKKEKETLRNAEHSLDRKQIKVVDFEQATKIRPSTSVKPKRVEVQSRINERSDDESDDLLEKKRSGQRSQTVKFASPVKDMDKDKEKRSSTSTADQTISLDKPEKQDKHPASSSKQRDSKSKTRDDSVETVKKSKNNNTSFKKQKIKHKITMHIHHERPELTLIKHFLEIGEWKKVSRPDDAQFTFVNNERKLDWDISLRTMVSLLVLMKDQQSAWSELSGTKERIGLHSEQVQGLLLRE